MSDQRSIFPEGLTSTELGHLERFAYARNNSPKKCLAAAEEYLERIEKLAKRHVVVNYPLAAAMVSCFRQLLDEWTILPAYSQPWLLGAMCYFVSAKDSEPDLESFVGFEDDVHVLNACLHLAGRYELKINPEDYDDVSG